MKWHCGYLADRQERDRDFIWARHATIWTLPPDVQHELILMLSTPGFAVDYHQNMLGWARQHIERHIAWAQERANQAEIAENWLSITRDDAMRFAQRRPFKGSMPLICKIHIAEDKAKGRRTCDIMRDYRCTHTTIRNIRRYGPFQRNFGMPSWFLENTPH